jgi:histidine phosphotransfer protein HptB
MIMWEGHTPIVKRIHGILARVSKTGCGTEGEMIDWKRVEELRNEIGADDFLEVTGMFMEEADQTIVALSGDLLPREVEGQLHFLKGSALNLGLVELAAICQEGERQGAADHRATVDLTRVVAVYHASKVAFLGGLARDTAA